MSKMICLCNRVNAKDVEKVFTKHPQANLRDVINLTAAATSCGRCRTELEAFVEQVKSKQSTPASCPQLTIPFNFS